MTTSTRPRRRALGKSLASAGLATGFALASTVGNTAYAHTRDSDYVRVVALPASVGCVNLRAELKHNGNAVRVWGKVRSYKGAPNTSGGYSCSTGGQHLKLRLKQQLIRQASSGGSYSVCVSTIGDGRGAAGYAHSEGTAWEMGRYMSYQGQEYFTYPCGKGNYRAKSFGHAYNGGWNGGDVDSPGHSFPLK